VMGVVGSLIGSLLYYWLGYALGPDRMRALVERYGVIHIGRFSLTVATVGAYDRALEWLDRRGVLFIIIGRNLPVVHSMVSIPAGVARMNLFTFLLATTIGVFSWVAPLTIFGYWLGSNWDQMLNILDVYQVAWYILIVVSLIVWFVWRRASRRRAAAINTEMVFDDREQPDV